ncbi:MAG: hypothetical protein IPG64_09125 [Haliea sp.]|nr:hypothetical protein [Haliea sp.]
MRARQFFEELAHPVVGSHLHVTPPFSFANMQRQQQPWLRLPAPTLGEHNRHILKKLLAYTDAMIDQLEQAEVIGRRPTGF